MSESMFPAPAGMSPRGNQSPGICEYVPRTRGDEPVLYTQGQEGIQCSPHPRG